MSDDGNASTSSTLSWSAVSFDMKGLFFFHVTMMVLLIFGDAVSLAMQFGVAAFAGVVIFLASAVRRRRYGWKWRGASIWRRLWAVFTGALIALFVVVGTFLLGAKVSFIAPWTFAAIGIGVFSVLNILQIVHRTEEGFRTDCMNEALPNSRSSPPESGWKRTVRVAFMILFIATWLEGLAAFYVFQSVFSGGSPVATVEKTEVLNNHGQQVFVSPADKRLVDGLLQIMFVCIPAVIVTGIFLQVVLKMRLEMFQTD